MLSVPLMLFRSEDAAIHVLSVRPKASKCVSSVWLGRFLAGFGAHLALPARKSVAGTDQERLASSPCPSSSSSGDSSSNTDSSANFSGSTSDSEDETSANNGSNGGGGDDQKEKKEDRDDGNGSDSSSSSDSSADESDLEEDDGVLIDTDDEKDKTHDGVDPTDDDDSEESDGSSDLENSYPRLPSAPVDKLISFRQQASHKELQLTEKLNQEVIADARQRHQERQEAQRSKKKKQTSNFKRRHSRSDVVSNGPMRRERHHTNGSTDVMMASQEQEGDEWMVDCSCGLQEKNYDDGTSMIQCDSCSHWVHAKCADKQPEAVAREKFLCFRCGWMFDCVCSVRRQPNHDDGQRMVECESCKTWQHTMCVRIPMTEEPADDYRCPRCVRKARRRKSASKGSRSRDRQQKRSHAESPRHRTDASPVVAVKVRSSARSLNTLTTPTRSHRSRRADPKKSSKMEKRAPVALAPSSPPFTPPPPLSPPPPSVVPSHARSGSTKRDRSRGHTKRRSERERKRSSGSSTLSHRKRGRSLGSYPSSAKKTHAESSEMEHYAPPPTVVTPSPRGKGLMLRGYSPAAARPDTSSSRSVNVRPPLPLTPSSVGASSGNSYNSHNNYGRKRNVSSARDRLAKKLKIRKSSR